LMLVPDIDADGVQGRAAPEQQRCGHSAADSHSEPQTVRNCLLCGAWFTVHAAIDHGVEQDRMNARVKQAHERHLADQQ